MEPLTAGMEDTEPTLRHVIITAYTDTRMEPTDLVTQATHTLPKMEPMAFSAESSVTLTMLMDLVMDPTVTVTTMEATRLLMPITEATVTDLLT